ncbi:MAG: glycosyltransferase family 4 protein [Muribaculaceae bacterium]|nr:glycosyltransferase family 4 protein [Muribaculaceae bacterium]
MIYIVITPFFPEPDNFRGPYVYDQVKAIINSNKFDRVIVFKPSLLQNNEKDYVYDGIEVYRFNTLQVPSSILPGAFDWYNIKSLYKKLKSLNIRFSDIAIAHSHVTELGIYANALKNKNPKIKTLLQHHGFDILSLKNGRCANMNWHKKYMVWYGSKICNKIDINVGVSNKTLEYLTSYKEVKTKHTYTLYNGVDTTKFYPTSMKKEKSDKFIIGCVANFWKLKDQITLIKAVGILKDKGYNNILIRFIGSGATLNSCKEYVENNNLNEQISFETEIGHRELNDYYNSLDLFVLPSYWEAFGCVYTEAYACGVPFIAVKGQGISELIPEKDIDKWLIDKGDFVSLSEKIETYIINRYKQELTTNIDINYLVCEFLQKLDH